jgi:hypothetical protein
MVTKVSKEQSPALEGIKSDIVPVFMYIKKYWNRGEVE